MFYINIVKIKRINSPNINVSRETLILGKKSFILLFLLNI